MKTWLAVALCALTLLSGCGGSDSADTVRSGDGPTQAASDDAAQEPAEESVEGAAVGPATSPMLNIKGNFEVPAGEDGSLSIVVIGEPDQASGTVPVVIRNMTSSPLTNLEVSGTARDAPAS